MTTDTLTVLGGYLLGDEIGSGASSVVYAATYERLGRCRETLPYLHRADRLEPRTTDVRTILKLAESC